MLAALMLQHILIALYQDPMCSCNHRGGNGAGVSTSTRKI